MLDVLNLDVFKAPAMLGYVKDQVEQLHHRSKYLGPTILPRKRVEDLEWSYIKGYGNVPVMAEVVDFGSPSPIGTRRGRMEKVSGELVTIKRKYEIDVKTLQKLQRALASNAPAELKDALRAIFDDVDRVLANLAARVEYMRWQALTTGKVSFVHEDVEVTIDYGLPETNVLQVDTPWSDIENATPITDLMNLVDTIETATGVRPARAVCRRSTWNYLLRNKKEVQLWLHGTELRERLATPRELNDLLAEYDLPAFAIYEVKVAAEDRLTKTVTEIPLVPEDVVVLLPPSTVEVGNTLFGPTPTEVFDIAGYGTAIKEIQEGPDYIVRIYREGNDPGVVFVAGECTAVPTLPGIQYIGVLKVGSSS